MNYVKNYLDKVEQIWTKEKTTQDNVLALYYLLTDHPYFQELVEKLRLKYKLPKDGFPDGGSSLDWEHSDKNRKGLYVKDVQKFVYSFAIPRVYFSQVEEFIYYYILQPNRATILMNENEEVQEYVKRKTVGANIVETHSDREVNQWLIHPNSLYIEVFPHTTTRDLNAALESIKASKKNEKPFYNPKPQDIAKAVWRLRKKYTLEQIASIINDGFNTKLKRTNVSTYYNRYKKILNKLRPFA